MCVLLPWAHLNHSTGVVGGLVLMVVIVMMVLYMRHRNITAAPALVIEETVDYGASSNNSRTLIGFKNPMYDDHSGNKVSVSYRRQD